MQEAVWGALTREAQAYYSGRLQQDPDEDDWEDFGFNHDWHLVLEMFNAATLFHILPEEGGWLDQQDAWRQDLLTMAEVRAQIFDIYRPRSSKNDAMGDM